MLKFSKRKDFFFFSKNNFFVNENREKKYFFIKNYIFDMKSSTLIDYSIDM